MNNKIKQNTDSIFLVGILILALILRFSKMLWQRDFWYDEAFTGIITRMSWSDMWWMIFHDVHPPLYYYLLKPWASFFDYSAIGFRSFSVVFGILSVMSIYWIGYKLFDKKVGLIGAFLMTLSPFAVQYSQEARMYSLFGFISLWLTYFFIKALKSNNWHHWLVWGVIGSLFFYTHYLALFTLVVFYLVALGYQFVFDKRHDSLKKKTWNDKIIYNINKFLISKKFIGAVAVIGVAFILWLPAFKEHRSREGLGWVPIIYISEVPQTIQFFLYGHQPGKILEPIPNNFRSIKFSLSKEDSGNLFDGATLGLLFLIGILIGVIHLWRQDKYRREIFILGGLAFGVLIFLSLLSQIGWRFYVARYFMATAVLVYLLLAVVIASSNRWWRWGILAFYSLTLLWLSPISYEHSWTDVLNDKKIVNNDTVIIADNAFEYATARFHFGEGRVKLYNKGEPTQDLSSWIIIKEGDQINSLDQYRDSKNVIYVGAGDCHWNQYELQLSKTVGRLKICKKVTK
jgi:uncharacterized membrane protein